MKPQQVELIGKKKVYCGLAGVNSSFIITNKGEIYYWGKPFCSMEGKGNIYVKPTQLELTQSSKDFVSKLDMDDKEWCKKNKPKKRKRKVNKDLKNSVSSSDSQEHVIAYEQFDYGADKVVFVKIVSYGYNYAIIDLKGRIYTFGENNAENLGFKINDKRFISDEANLVSQLSDWIVFDASLSEKNLFLILETRTDKNESLWWDSLVCRKFIKMHYKFTKLYLKDLVDHKTGYKMKTLTERLVEKGIFESFNSYPDFNKNFEKENPRKSTRLEGSNQGSETAPNFYIKSGNYNKTSNNAPKTDRNVTDINKPKVN